MKKYIPTLMNIYQDMVSINEKQKIKYEKAKKEWMKKQVQSPYMHFYNEKERIYSHAIMHNLITLISKMENSNEI